MNSDPGRATRRELLKALGRGALGGASLLSGLPSALAFTSVVCSAIGLPPSKAHASSKRLLTKRIPKTREAIPVIGMGTSRTFDVGIDTVQLAPLIEVMRAFFAGGGKLIDSSPMYGKAEAVIGKVLETTGKPAGFFAATKVWTDGQEAGVEQMERSRGLWGVERFDLIQIHNLRDWRVHLRTLRTWKEQGRVRYIGITTSHGRSHDELASILAAEELDFVQLSYNVLDREVEARLLPLAADRGLAVIVNRPFQRGDLFQKMHARPLPTWAAEIDCQSWGQIFLKFAVSHPSVTCAIPASSKAKHMADNMGAAVGRLPNARLRKRIIETIESA